MTDPTDDLRHRAAQNRGLAPSLADRLRGSTLEELEHDADSLRAAVSPPEPTPDFHGGARQSVPAEEAQFDAYKRHSFPKLYRDER